MVSLGVDILWTNWEGLVPIKAMAANRDLYKTDRWLVQYLISHIPTLDGSTC